MDTGSERNDSVESAIDEVLRVEQAAMADIAASEREAEEILRDARQAVRAVWRRTEQRLSNLHAGCAAKTRELIDEIEQSAGQRAACDVPDDDQRHLLDNAIRAVAAELTSRGGADGD